jgi:dTDP-4-amino-4,6-dideoxy-D-galactose acyltransferase
MDYACRYLEWDSQFFGKRIARLDSVILHPEALQSANSWCREQHIDCLYYLVPAFQPDTVRLLEDDGFRLVDIRLTLECRVTSSYPKPISANLQIRPASQDDLPALKAIAGSSYAGTRFFNDPGFGTEKARRLYVTWITNSLSGFADQVLVAENRGTVSGFITVRIDQSTHVGQIGLVGVAEDSRGLGIGAALVTAASGWFGSHEVEQVKVVTQGSNQAALRLYQSAGFRLAAIELWYHKWFAENHRA